jgi:hypothetical protein
MGIKYAHVYSYILTDLCANDVYRIAVARLEKRNNKIDDVRKHRKRPSIDIDVSLLIRNRGNPNIKSNSTYLINFATLLIDIGFNVMMVFDGNTRHHSKRVTSQRLADNKRKKIEIVIRKAELMSTAQRRRTLDSIEERKILIEEEEEIKKRIKTLENSLQHSTIDVGDNLFNTFKEATKKLTPNKIICLSFCQSVFQADSVMAGHIISGDTEILLTSDSDQLALLGSKCVSIKKWRFKSSEKSKSLDSLDIFTANETTMNNILNSLNLPLYDNQNLIKPKYPIFDNVDCYRLRALLAVGLGCDVNLNSIVTPSKLFSFIKNSPLMQGISNEDAYYAVKKFYINIHNRTDKHFKKKKQTKRYC